MNRLSLFVLLVGLAGCGRFDNGDEVIARVQRDPNDHCRLIIMDRGFGEGTPPMVARIDGCVPDAGGADGK